MNCNYSFRLITQSIALCVKKFTWNFFDVYASKSKFKKPAFYLIKFNIWIKKNCAHRYYTYCICFLISAKQITHRWMWNMLFHNSYQYHRYQYLCFHISAEQIVYERIYFSMLKWCHLITHISIIDTSIYVSKFLPNKSHVSEYGIYCSMLKWCHLITHTSGGYTI